MYTTPPPVSQAIKMVRPRSSISAASDEYERQRCCSTLRNPTLTEKTLCGLSLFLLSITICLFTALVIVGQSLVSSSNHENTLADKHNSRTHDIINNSNNNIIKKPSDLVSTSEKETLKNQLFLQPKQVLQHHKFKSAYSSVSNQTRENKSYSGNKEKSDKIVIVMSKIIEKLSFRLPKQIIPTQYQLYLYPNLKNKQFSGSVTIRLNITKPISFIPIHSKRLDITATNIYKLTPTNDKPSQIWPVQSYEYEPHEYWVTEFEKDLDIGEYLMKLTFNGSLTDRIIGFYQSSYFDPISNQTKWIATSKFEPTFARQAYPCFDEPQLKASFIVTLVRPTDGNYSALSNMDVEEEIENGDVTTVRFKESVKMSTYLSCFIVSNFEHKTKTIDAKGIGKNFDLRVFATPAQLNKVDFAMETGKGIIEFYIQYFKIEYPLPKLDMVAIPDFVSGAMEHWGLVTFRETALLYDKLISSSNNKLRVGTVVAHELAHMWFGNLVTMKWWNDLWLNEGFASYIEYKGLDAAYPEWNMLDKFIVDDMHDVLKLDATLASHPIVQKVENPDQITELFDTITYQKGASIIRMLEDFVGPEKFRDAVSNYLNNFKFGNAVTDDLLTEIEALNFDFDVKQVMQTWTEQMGLPVVQVTKINDTNYKITQSRFLSNPEDAKKEYRDSPFNYRWSIPITYFTSNNSDIQRKWFLNSDVEETISLDEPVKWLKLNKNQNGYYRVNYSDEMWQILISALMTDQNKFSACDRANLLNDAFALADATHIPFATALNLTKYLENEYSYTPWSVAVEQIDSLRNALVYTDAYESLLIYGRKLVDKQYKELQWNVDDNLQKNLLRVEILNAACNLEHKDCLDEVRKRFMEWLKDTSKRPNADIRSTVYYHGMQVAGNEAIWNEVWNVFINEHDASEKQKLMSALSAIRSPWILKKYIDLAWDEKYVRGQDYFACLQYISKNPAGESLVWDYVRENWPKFTNRFGLNERNLGRLIPSITQKFATQIKLEEMEKFFADYPDAGAGVVARKQAIENVKNNIKWLEVNKEKIADWLKKN